MMYHWMKVCAMPQQHQPMTGWEPQQHLLTLLHVQVVWLWLTQQLYLYRETQRGECANQAAGVWMR